MRNLRHAACSGDVDRESNESPWAAFVPNPMPAKVVWRCRRCQETWSDREIQLMPRVEFDRTFFWDIEGPGMVLVEEQIGDKRFTRLVPEWESHKYKRSSIKVDA